MSTDDILLKMRKQVLAYIDKNYETVEDFCWDKGLNKATISNFLNNKKDFQISTLKKIAESVKMRLDINLK